MGDEDKRLCVGSRADRLSKAERRVAECVCRGLTEKETAAMLYRSPQTIHTQKKSIYRKLGVSKDTELMWWMICERLRMAFDLDEIRKHGIELLMVVLLLAMQVTGNAHDLRRCGGRRKTQEECITIK